MNKRKILSLLLACLMLVGTLTLVILPSSAAVVTTPPTGYTKAEDVVYKTFTEGKFKVTANWGARGEDCVFLTTPALAYYVGGYTYDTLSEKAGGSSQGDAHQSELYKALQAMMKAEHTYQTNYQETRPLYAYTDCASNETSKLVSFYSGTLHTSVWDSGKTWNREHTWPNSKGMEGRDEDDIMMLRPTLVKENGSRGNKAYGESAGYQDPGESVRGDCARIVLYVYTRWGNTGKMWGSTGVIENLDLLLRWMQEDPVDTWEMGRNDAVESITGVRNVFVDYPEYAWLLFGREIPIDYVTPSGIAAAGEEIEETTEVPTEPETTVSETDPETTVPESVPETTVSETASVTELTTSAESTIVTEQVGTMADQTAPEPPDTDLSDSTGMSADSDPADAADIGCTSAYAGMAIVMLLLPAAWVLKKNRDEPRCMSGGSRSV